VGLAQFYLGQKSIFFQINMTQKAATMCAPVGLDPTKTGQP
jgi:hypothetical protein